MGETEDYAEDVAILPHGTTHQDGGSDEVNVEDLSGELADDQKSTWPKVSGKPSTFPPEAHAGDHAAGGDDEIDVSGLTPMLHALTHKLGGSDEIDVSGLVHTSVCRAYLSANQDIPNVTTTKVALDVADIDRNSDFDTGNNKFVVPSAGVYLFLGQIHWSAIIANKHTVVSIQKNPFTLCLMDGHTGFTTAFGLACFTVALCAVDDEITLHAYQNTTATRTLYSGVNRTQLIVVRLY